VGGFGSVSGPTGRVSGRVPLLRIPPWTVDPPDDWEDDFGEGEVEDYDPEADWSPGDEFLPGEAARFRAPIAGQ